MKHFPAFVFILALLVLGAAGDAPGVLISYQQDAAGRLVSASYGGDSRSAFAYDKNSNLLSRANSADQRPALAATFNGLVTNNAAQSAVNTGPITLKMLGTGGFTGKVTLGGVAYNFTGIFALDGSTAPIQIAGKPPLGAATLTLSLDVAGGTQLVTGNLTAGLVVSNVVLGRAGFDTKTTPMPAGFVGKYTAFLIPEDAVATTPQGLGYATVTVTAAAGLTAAGKLADGSTFTHASTLLQSGTQWLFFVPLYANKGHISGQVSFESRPGESDFGAYLTWFKPGGVIGPVYPAGFTTHPALLGSRYVAPAAGQRALVLPNVPLNLFVGISGAALAPPIFTNVTLDAKNLFVIPLPNTPKLKLSLIPTTGLFTGSFLQGAKTRTVGGVLYQELNRGFGMFVGDSESGPVQLDANP